MKVSKVKEISKKFGYLPQEIQILTKEASDREYFRLIFDKPRYKKVQDEIWDCEYYNKHYKDDKHSASLIFCYINPELGSNKRFVELSNHISESEQYAGMVFPKIYAFDDSLGVTIQQDCFETILERYPNGYHGYNGLMTLQIGLLALDNFLYLEFLDLKVLTNDDLRNQMDRFEKLFLYDFLGIDVSDLSCHKRNLQNLIDETLQNLSKQPWVNCHQDFEVRNLMETPLNTAIIDFQDTCKGPIGIDLAGLFIDHYNFEITFGEAKRDNVQEQIEHGGLDIMGIKEAEIMYDYAIWGGIQRNLRILGTLSNLYLENGRDFRLPDLPKILSNLEQIIPEKHKELKNFLKQDVNLALNQKLMELGL